MHSDCLQTWRPHSIFQTPPGSCLWSSQQCPHQRDTAACAWLCCLPLCHISHPCFHPWRPLSSAGSWSGQQHSMPRLLPWFLLLPSSIPSPSCPRVFISLLTREQGAPSHPNPATEVWQHPVGFHSWAELRIIKGPDGFLPQFGSPGRLGCAYITAAILHTAF